MITLDLIPFFFSFISILKMLPLCVFFAKIIMKHEHFLFINYVFGVSNSSWFQAVASSISCTLYQCFISVCF